MNKRETHIRTCIPSIRFRFIVAFLICLTLKIPQADFTIASHASAQSSAEPVQESREQSEHDPQIPSEQKQPAPEKTGEDEKKEKTGAPQSEEKQQKPDETLPQQEELKPETIVDVIHAEISRRIQGTATWMDSFFGDKRYESELNKSYVRFRYNVLLEDGTGMVRKADYQVRMILPQLREKTKLVLSGSPKEESEFSALRSSYEYEQITTTEERNVTAALYQTVRETARDSFIIRAGLQMHSGRPAIVLGPRYRILFPLDSWNLRLIEEILWKSDVGLASRASVDLERPLPNGLFFRATNEWSWTQHVDGFLYAFSFHLGQPINHKRGLNYEWINIFHTQPVNELTEIVLRVRYRQQFWRDWLFFEISPQYRFPRDRSFNATPGIWFTIDMVLGSYSRISEQKAPEQAK